MRCFRRTLLSDTREECEIPFRTDWEIPGYREDYIRESAAKGGTYRERGPEGPKCTCARYEHNAYVCPVCRGGSGSTGPGELS